MSLLRKYASGSERKVRDAARILETFDRKVPPPWPSPHHSLGDKIETKNVNIKEKVWIAKGPALQLFETQIRPQLYELLHSTDLLRESPLFLEIYMMGEEETRARPVLMICCYDEKVRRRTEAVIRESNILQNFPQIGVESTESLLETKELGLFLLQPPRKSVFSAHMPWHLHREDVEFMNNARLGGTTLLGGHATLLGGDTTLLGGDTTVVDSSTFIAQLEPDIASLAREYHRRNRKTTHTAPEPMEGSIEGIRGVGTLFDGKFSIPELLFEDDNLSIRNSDDSARKKKRDYLLGGGGVSEMMVTGCQHTIEMLLYGEDLAARLCQDLSPRTFGKERFERVSDSLPHILQIFAFKVAKEKIHEDYRIELLLKIQSSFASQIISKARDMFEESAQQFTTSEKEPAMPRQDKVGGWLSRRDALLDLPPESGYRGAEQDWSDNEMDTEHGFLRLVTQTRAYKWLSSKLRSELELVNPTGTGIARLSEAMFRDLDGIQSLSRNATSKRIDAIFCADWSPHSFLENQEYGVSPEEAVVKALVLVGTKTQAEGLACGDYLSRQWPDSAENFMELLQSVVKSPEGTIHREKLGDGTTLQASAQSGRFSLRASGHPDSVVEVGEQLMWIGCALRSSDFTGVGTCQPSFAKMATTQAAPWISMRINLSATPKFDKLHGPESGTCWQGLFRNPLVVEGYPISRLQSPDSILGLQLSLGTLMTLVPNSRIVPYMGRLFIKRFSTLLVAVKRIGDVILWHAISNKDGSYVYYHDKRVNVHDVKLDPSILQEVDIAELKHVVGWTSMADNSAGTSNCNHRIRGSGLSQSPVPELELERITIGFSKVGTANASVKLGWRDKSISTTQEGDYRANIKFISEKFVILYDIEDHRGFLLDGGTALLYLLRVSLISDEQDGLFDNRKVNDNIQLHHHWDPRIRAINTLWRNENAGLKLYYNYNESSGSTEVKNATEDSKSPVTTMEEVESRKGSWVLLSDRVNSILSMLDQAINKQGDKEFKLLLNKLPGQYRLEGYDFRNLAHKDKASVQFTTPGLHSKGWLDLSQKLSAVTLFGRGFGDIIRHSGCAADTPYMCPDWRCVPRGLGYLAASNATMERVLENGDVNAWRLIDDIYMNCPQDPFRSCEREGQRCVRRHYLIKGQNKKLQKGALVLPRFGALIIGYESNMPTISISSPFNKLRRTDQLLVATSNGIEDAFAPGTSIGPLSSESSRSVDTTRPIVSLATSESSGVRPAPTPDTTIEPSQYSVELSRSSEPSQSQSSKLLGALDSLAPSSAEEHSSESNKEPEPPGGLKPKDPVPLRPQMANAHGSRETSRERSFRGWWKRVSLVRKNT